MSRILVYIVTLILFFGCSGTKDVTRFKKDHLILSLEKGECYGTCSVYNVRIYKNRYAVYEGIMNVEKFGLYSKKLSKEEYKQLVDEFDKAGFFTFQDFYIYDEDNLPLITMQYRKKDVVKLVKGSVDRPQEVLDLQYKLEKLYKTEGWKLVKAYEPKYNYQPEQRHSIDGDQMILSQIIIEPGKDTHLAHWLKKYTDYDVQLVKKLSPDMNYWLITYNADKVSPNQIMDILKKDRELNFVEFNKRVSPREH